jgi:putative ABC transport system permease protein
MNGGALSFYLLTHYATNLKTPVAVAISSRSKGTNTYVNNKKIAINYKYTNAAFWDVLEFDFLEGRAISPQQIANGEHVTVISEDIKKEYFGDLPSVVGKYIEADNVQYRVCGVIKNVPATLYMFYSDIYLPYTVSKGDEATNKGYRGDYMGILLAPSPAEVPRMKAEYEEMIARLPMSSKDYTKIYSLAEPFIASYVSTGNEEKSGMTYTIALISIFTLLIMLMPTLNLVNINITRIMERSSEIGVRKAFGASSRTLVYQFIVENLILTILGGAIGVILSGIILHFLNKAQLIANLEMTLDLTVLFIGLLICLVFGILSGVYPAWRMSRLNVVDALKAQ